MDRNSFNDLPVMSVVLQREDFLPKGCFNELGYLVEFCVFVFLFLSVCRMYSGELCS